MNDVISVTLALNLGQHPAQGVESKQILFTAFPTTEDLVAAVDGDDKWSALVDACEVPEVAEYQPDFLEEDGFVSFDCQGDDNEPVGSIIIERMEVLSSSLIEVGVETA